MRPRPHRLERCRSSTSRACSRAWPPRRPRAASRSSTSDAATRTSLLRRTSSRRSRARRPGRTRTGTRRSRSAGAEGGDRCAVPGRVRRRDRSGARGGGAAGDEDGADGVRAGDGRAGRRARASGSRLSRLPLGGRPRRGRARAAAAPRRRTAGLGRGAGGGGGALSQLSVESDRGRARPKESSPRRSSGRTTPARGCCTTSRTATSSSTAAARPASSPRRARATSGSSCSRCRSRTGWRAGGSASRSGTRSWSRGSRISRTTSSPACSRPSRRRAIAALTGPQESVEDRRALYERRRDRVVAALAGLDARGEGTFFVWFRLPDGTSVRAPAGGPPRRTRAGRGLRRPGPRLGAAVARGVGRDARPRAGAARGGVLGLLDRDRVAADADLDGEHLALDPVAVCAASSDSSCGTVSTIRSVTSKPSSLRIALTVRIRSKTRPSSSSSSSSAVSSATVTPSGAGDRPAVAAAALDDHLVRLEVVAGGAEPAAAELLELARLERLLHGAEVLPELRPEHRQVRLHAQLGVDLVERDRPSRAPRRRSRPCAPARAARPRRRAGGAAGAASSPPSRAPDARA